MPHFKYEASVPKIKPPSGEVIVAIDGSHREKIHSSAYLTTSGEFGIQAAAFSLDRCRPQCSLSTELRAALYGLRRVSDIRRIMLLSDNKTAIGWINRWRDGEQDLPSWYSTFRNNDKTSSLEELRGIAASRKNDLRIAHVKGHSGDLLNEAADALAGIGSNVIGGVYDKVEARERSMKLAQSFLHSYQQSR